MSTLTASHRTRRDRFSDWAVVGLVALALIAGWLVKTSAENASQSISGDAGSFTYPIGWQSDKSNGLFAQDTRTTSGVPTEFGITAEPLESDQGLDALSTRQTIRRSQELDGFSMLGTSKETVNGDAAVTLNYAYVTVPDVGTAASRRLPVVVEATDTLVKRGSTLYILHFSADSAAFAGLDGLRANLFNSVRLP